MISRKNNKFKTFWLVMTASTALIVMGLLGAGMSEAEESPVIVNAPVQETVAIANAAEQEAAAPVLLPVLSKDEPSEDIVKEQPVQNQDDGLVPFPMPSTHKGNWVRYHGTYVPLSFNEAGQRGTACYVCHDQNDCVSCHSTTSPLDHTGFWRNRGHGLAAGGDRQRCQQCHRQDFCVRCHNETSPRTHKGNWEDRHCGWCHYSSTTAPQDNCSVCHRVASHSSAPHPVVPSADCSACHS